jgi:hypothetical protein
VYRLQKKLEDCSSALESDMARALEEARGRLEAIFLDRQEMRGDINKVVELIAGLQVRAEPASCILICNEVVANFE